MTATVVQAREDMNQLVSGILVTAYPHAKVFWDGVEQSTPPAPLDTWARVTIRHTNGGQATLSGAFGKRRWARSGLLLVQCFVPLPKGGVDAAVAMGELLLNGVQSAQTPNGVWFRNATSNEVGKDDPWYQVNFSANFTYDTFA